MIADVIIGATAGVGLALCNDLAKRGHDLVIVASDQRDLLALSNHLKLKYGVEVIAISADASDPVSFTQALIKNTTDVTAISGLYFPIGVSYADDIGGLDQVKTITLINANLLVVISIVDVFMEKVRASLKPGNTPRIVGFGSIAGIRGRSKNIVYSSAKCGLECYFESLRHQNASSELIIQFYKLGYVQTQQSFGQKLALPSVSVDEVVKRIAVDSKRDFGSKFYPRYWQVIAWVLQALPWFVFKRLNF